MPQNLLSLPAYLIRNMEVLYCRGMKDKKWKPDTPSPKHHSAEPSKSTLHKIIIHRNYFAKIEKDPISMFQGLGKKRRHLERTTNFLFSVSELDSNFAEFAKIKEFNFR